MITIGKSIYAIMVANAELTAMVDTRIYPVVVPDDKELPLIAYQRRTSSDYNKDGKLKETTFEMIIKDGSYSNTINVAIAVQDALEGYSGTIAGNTIRDIRLVEVDEGFDGVNYSQSLVFNIKST